MKDSAYEINMIVYEGKLLKVSQHFLKISIEEIMLKMRESSSDFTKILSVTIDRKMVYLKPSDMVPIIKNVLKTCTKL